MTRTAASVGLLIGLLACGGDVGIAELADGGFVIPVVDSGDVGDDGGPDGGASGCAVMALGSCDGDRLCCDTPTERCVPTAGGENMCVAAGPVGEGGECGDSGADDCGFGLICASSTSGRERLVCRALCPNGRADCGGAACRVEAEVAGESIALCE